MEQAGSYIQPAAPYGVCWVCGHPVSFWESTDGSGPTPSRRHFETSGCIQAILDYIQGNKDLTKEGVKQ